MDFETEQRIERLEQLVATLYQHLGLNGQEEFLPASPLLPPPQPTQTPGVAQPTDPRLSPAFFDALQKGKTINAIKIYREATGVGLKEAKDYVDALEGKHKRR